MAETTLVLGATGAPVVRQLRQDGFGVRTLVREGFELGTFLGWKSDWSRGKSLTRQPFHVR